MLAPKFPVVLAPTGTIPTKKLTPFVPITPREIAEDVYRCSQIGITSVHIHARDADGEPGWNRDLYASIIYEIKLRTPDILINVSTSGRNWSDLEKRADCLALDGDLKPDLASLTLSSLNFVSGPSINSTDTISALAKIMLERDIIPELEIFDLGMVNMVKVLRGKGLLPKPLVANLFMGNIASAQTTPSELGVMVDRLPEGVCWSGAGIGAFRDRAHALALASGGGVRVGLEDGIFLDTQRQHLATNEQLVERVHKMASLLDVAFMEPHEFRESVLGK